ncbi:MAG TPA: LysR family transcriptional regulator [Rhizomicrobium sp.]
MDGLSLDQIEVLLSVVENGSFSSAGRALNRAQSAITYAIQRLEEQVGAPLFNRDAYRPVLTDAGRAMLPQARRILAEVQAFRIQAAGISGGLEPELTLVLDSMFPIQRVLPLLKAFRGQFPSVRPRIYVESLGAAAGLVIDGTCDLGLMPMAFSLSEVLQPMKWFSIELLPVAAPTHPLAQIGGVIDAALMADHVQLVLTDRSGLTGTRDYGVLSAMTWRLGDLGAKHAMLLSGLGWGSMPSHLVADDLAQGRLVLLRPEQWRGRSDGPTLDMCCVHRTDAPLGPAARWFLERCQAD